MATSEYLANRLREVLTEGKWVSGTNFKEQIITTDWQDLVFRFCKDAEKFIALVAEMPEDRLLQNFAGENYGNYKRNIDVMIEHTYYHLGQILIIKKLLCKRNAIP